MSLLAWDQAWKSGAWKAGAWATSAAQPPAAEPALAGGASNPLRHRQGRTRRIQYAPAPAVQELPVIGPAFMPSRAPATLRPIRARRVREDEALIIN